MILLEWTLNFQAKMRGKHVAFLIETLQLNKGSTEQRYELQPLASHWQKVSLTSSAQIERQKQEKFKSEKKNCDRKSRNPGQSDVVTLKSIVARNTEMVDSKKFRKR